MSCQYHLLLDVTVAGSLRSPHTVGVLKQSHTARDVVQGWIADAAAALDAMDDTCALDVADRGGADLHQIAALLGRSPQAVFLVSRDGLATMRGRFDRMGISDELAEGLVDVLAARSARVSSLGQWQLDPDAGQADDDEIFS